MQTTPSFEARSHRWINIAAEFGVAGEWFSILHFAMRCSSFGICQSTRMGWFSISGHADIASEHRAVVRKWPRRAPRFISHNFQCQWRKTIDSWGNIRGQPRVRDHQDTAKAKPAIKLTPLKMAIKINIHRDLSWFTNYIRVVRCAFLHTMRVSLYHYYYYMHEYWIVIERGATADAERWERWLCDLLINKRSQLSMRH